MSFLHEKGPWWDQCGRVAQVWLRLVMVKVIISGRTPPAPKSGEKK